MNRRTTVVDKAAEQLVNMDNANYADERERSVYLEAQAYGMQLATLTCWFAALVLAFFGQLLAPLALVLAPLIPALGSQWYANRRGVNPFRLMARGPAAKTLAWSGFSGLLLFGISAAMVHRAYFGEGVIDFSITFEVVGDDLQRFMAIAAIICVGVGALGGVLTMGYLIWHNRRIEQRELAEDEEDAATPTSSISPATSVFLLAVGIFVAALGLIPIIFGPANTFAITFATLGILYGAAMAGLYVKTRRTS